MNRILDQLREFWAGLEPRQRWVLLGTLAATLIALVAVGVWASKESYETVTRSDDPAEIRQIAEVLAEQGIPYRVAPNGLSIEAPTNVVGQAKISSSETGHLVGFEILETLQLGSTPRRDRWAFQRALQGELTRTVNALEEIDSSRVHLVLPERTPFLGSDQPGSASVSIKLRPGRQLAGSQIRGITALVAGAVDGLSPSDVVLIDENGRLLSTPSDDAEMAAGSNLFQMRRAYENRYESAIRSAILPILGSAEGISIAVTAELETTSLERTIQSIDPTSQVPLSEKLREEDSTDTRPGGVPGTEANLPENEADATGNSRSVSDSTVNYEYARTQERKVELPGRLSRISAAVVVNDALIQSLVADAEDVEAEAAKLQKKIRETVRTAVGHDEERGDVVEVTFAPFAPTPELEEPGIVEQLQSTINLSQVVAALAVILFFVFVARPLMQQISGSAPGRKSVARRDGDDGKTGSESTDGLTSRLRYLVDNFEPVSSQDLNRLVEAQSEASVQVIRRWLRA